MTFSTTTPAVEPRIKNGPALAGYSAEAMREAIASKITTMPEQLRRTLKLKIDANVAVYFCDPQSLWQRGSNENTNGLLRQHFPRGTNLARWNVEEIEAVAAALNGRPRKTLGWKTPAEALNEHLLSLQQAGVATTG